MRKLATVVWRSFGVGMICLCITSSILVLSPYQVFADGAWDGCLDSNSMWVDGDPGDKSGCSVRFNGTGAGGAIGEYEYYNCSDPSKNAVCFYEYEVN